MFEKLPSLPDDGLKSLRANAQRLERMGSPDQRTSAAELLPAIEAEIARRPTKRPTRTQPGLTAAKSRSKPGRSTGGKAGQKGR
jgi:tRNA pseudouridine-54 N-methylase